MTAIDTKLQEISRCFCIQGKYLSSEQIKMGNINQTYKVTYLVKEGLPKSYIVQKINTHVFKNPEQVMSNIDAVTEHIRRKKKGVTLHFHHTQDRRNYVSDEDGFWRLINYIPSITYSENPTPEILYHGGSAFGEFQMQLQDFDASRLFMTIPDFHNTRKRLETLFVDADKDVCSRAEEAKEEIEYIRSVVDKACVLNDMLEAGKLPLRVTHNDTKINNVLFDRDTSEALVVIDLDTVMPGLVGHDFGDAVRFACNTQAEDSPRTEDVAFNLERFRSFAEGFLSQTRDVLTEAETETLALSAFTLTVELASRFLDDYLNGDTYFKTEYEEHNLTRARCQLALAKDIESKLTKMNQIVREICDLR